jgi:spore germination protein KC
MKIVTKNLRLLIFCLIPIILTGCWNNRSLTDLGIVVGVGLEKFSDDEIEITIQLLIPSRMESRKQGSMQKTTNSISAVGKTVFEANRNLLTKVNKTLFYGHIQLVVIGEKLAESGIEDVLDFFQRIHEIDKRELILVSKGISPKELFDVEAVQSDISSIEIIDTVKNTFRLGSIRKQNLYDVILKTAAGENPVVGMVEVFERKGSFKMTDLIFNGAAVFKRDKLIGWLNPKETYGYLIIDNKFENPILTISNPISPKKNVTIEITDASTEKSVYLKDEKPVLRLKVKLEGKMVEQHGKGDLTSTENIKALETEVSEQLKKIIHTVIKTGQNNFQTDIFGFDDIVHKKHLIYWREVKNNWDDVFSKSLVEIEVKYKNKDMGFIKAHK